MKLVKSFVLAAVSAVVFSSVPASAENSEVYSAGRLDGSAAMETFSFSRNASCEATATIYINGGYPREVSCCSVSCAEGQSASCVNGNAGCSDARCSCN